jgi:hypothetical protein
MRTYHRNNGIAFVPLLVIVLLLATAGAYAYSVQKNTAHNSLNSNVACTMEAKLCPNGSYVSRRGPRCEFDRCPDIVPVVSNDSGIEGTVTLGPTCPVMRIPPDPLCADRPYQATIIVRKSSDQKQITSFVSDTDGRFKVVLMPGIYTLSSANTSRYPYMHTQEVVITKGVFTDVTISFDTGIR